MVNWHNVFLLYEKNYFTKYITLAMGDKCLYCNNYGQVILTDLIVPSLLTLILKQLPSCDFMITPR